MCLNLFLRSLFDLTTGVFLPCPFANVFAFRSIPVTLDERIAAVELNRGLGGFGSSKSPSRGWEE